MSKRPQESDIEFIKALAELLRENDLTEIEVNRDYGDEDALTVRVRAGRSPPPAPQRPGRRSTIAAAPAAARRRPRAAAAGRGRPGRGPGRGALADGRHRLPAGRAGDAAFVKVGDAVTEGQTILIIEAMKTMNQIPAPRAGRVKRILVEDGSPVEFGAPLMILE